MSTAPLRIGTRGSEVALRQARIVQSALSGLGVDSELVVIRTTGDKKSDEPLPTTGTQGFFTKELDRALTKGKVDCCVHALEDVPTDETAGLVLAAVLKRDDPRDVLVVNKVTEAEGLDDLPRGSRVGTSSLRRRAQLLARRPDLEVVELGGTVPVRIKKVDQGSVHAAIFSAASLHRLGARGRITMYLDAPDWLPAPGQAAIAVQCRAGDAERVSVFAPLHDGETAIATGAERAFFSALEGGGQSPIGALAMTDGSVVVLHGLIGAPTGDPIVRGSLPVTLDDPGLTGVRLANDLRHAGAVEILDSLRRLEKVPRPQPE